MKELIGMVSTLNDVAVCIFGCILSAAFCGMGKTAKSRWKIAALTAGLLALQGGAVLCGFGPWMRAIYPLMTHLPLIIILSCLSKRKVWACGSVFVAYLCCQLRRWLGLFLLVPFDGSGTDLAVMELALTFPILYFLLKIVAPEVERQAVLSVRAQVQFCLIPVLYYIYDYLAIVYTDWMYGNEPVVMEFMPFICCAAYLVFLLRISSENKRRSALENDQRNLNLQIEQSLRELASLRESQRRAATYRHDLRHHMQYLSSCIENGEYFQAQFYIQGICDEIESQKVVSYCENEAVNLILSSYAGRAARAGAEMEIHVKLARDIKIHVNDLCVLISNALENALNACKRIPRGDKLHKIQIEGYEKDNRLFLQITNPSSGMTVFENGLPVTGEEGHGIGTRSILAIVERHNGLCSFSEENRRFILRVFL